MCDENGDLIDGDDILAIAGLSMLEQGTLKQKTVVATVMSNAGLETVLQKAGGTMLRTSVGDKHVIDKMLHHGYNLGGEQSGHLIFGDFSTTGDGLVAALQILHIMKTKQKPLSTLARCWSRFPQVVTNIRVREKRPLAEVDGLTELVAKAEQELKPMGGRVLLRYSGTEPKARLLIEGPDRSILEAWNTRISEVLKKHLGT